MRLHRVVLVWCVNVYIYCTMFSVQGTLLYNVLCARYTIVFSVQGTLCTMFSVQGTLCTMFSIQGTLCTMFSEQGTTLSNPQCTRYNVYNV